MRRSPAGPVDARAVLRSEVREKAFDAQVLQLARLCGWLAYHPYSSTRSPEGFPDRVFVRPPRILFVELKRERGRLSAEQERWAAALRACPGVEYQLWRPSDWEELVEVLR